MALKIDKNSYEVPAIFKLIESRGNIPERDMYNTFNMGIGMAIVLGADEADRAVKIINETGEKAYILGEIRDGTRGITLC